jgi:hypothetical protein
MNTLEMKISTFETITQTHDDGKIILLYDAMSDVVDEDDSDGWSDLTPEQQRKLEFAITQSYDPAQSVSYEDGLKMIDKWLTR